MPRPLKYTKPKIKKKSRTMLSVIYITWINSKLIALICQNSNNDQLKKLFQLLGPLVLE